MSFRFRHSICNEAFDKWPFADACRAIKRAGYTGDYYWTILEIDPEWTVRSAEPGREHHQERGR